MFHFCRTHHSPDAERYEILIPERGLPNAKGRFGEAEPFQGGGGWMKFHRVGMLFLLHGSCDDKGRKTIKAFLCGQASMTEEEKEILARQAGLLNDGYESTGGLEGSLPGWLADDVLVELPGNGKPECEGGAAFRPL
jgi:hypothetical protein